MSWNLSREERREAARHMAKESVKFPAHLLKIPRDQWPGEGPPGIVDVWRSRDYLVQVYAATEPAVARLSINRVAVAGQRFQDGIGWEDLQRLKRECGYGDCDAVEIFPRDPDVVNVANMRHLWVMREPLAFAWRQR